jgi:hypothetical protein
MSTVSVATFAILIAVQWCHHCVVLTRLDPHRYRFSVHWDPSASRLAEDWQRELGAEVVVNGSYFGQDNVPLTPLRISGKAAGPATYQSTHGAFVADGERVESRGISAERIVHAFHRHAAFPHGGRAALHGA